MKPLATTIAGVLLLTMFSNAEVICGKQLRLKPVRCVCGSLVDATRAPVAGVEVKVVKSGTDVMTVETDKEGKFIFANLKPGTYDLTAQAAGSKTFHAEIVVKGTSQKCRRRLVILLDTGGLESCGSYVIKQ